MKEPRNKEKKMPISSKDRGKMPRKMRNFDKRLQRKLEFRQMIAENHGFSQIIANFIKGLREKAADSLENNTNIYMYKYRLKIIPSK